MTSVKTNKKGFTLVELVVVIAILAILAAIAIPVVNSIINTASKNGALSNAQTIELAIKECQADIASKNNEVYKSTTVNGVTINDAASAHASIDVQQVAAVKAIGDAFKQVTYNGQDYRPYWSIDEDKVVYLAVTSTGTFDSSVATSLDGANAPASTGVSDTTVLAATGNSAAVKYVPLINAAAPSTGASATFGDNIVLHIVDGM